MTLNERLFASGLLDRFEHAVKEMNKDLMIELLGQVEIDKADAQEIIAALLPKP